MATMATGARIVTVVEDASATANYRYRSSFYCKAPGSHWSPVEADALPHLLLGRCLQALSGCWTRLHACVPA